MISMNQILIFVFEIDIKKVILFKGKGLNQGSIFKVTIHCFIWKLSRSTEYN
jgi:hypothetical protein